MKSVQLAERLRELQAYGQTRLAASGHSLDDIPDLVRQATKGSR